MIELKNLSIPPSVNNYWGQRGKMRFVNAKGKAFRSEVFYMFKKTKKKQIDGRLSVTVTVYQKDKRRRDLDNLGKSLLDSMQHAGVYKDDSQIDRLLFERKFDSETNHCRVQVRKIA